MKSRMISRIIKGLKKPNHVLLYFMEKKAFRVVPDKYYLKVKYRLSLGEKLNLNQPIGYNEKLQWLKLHDRKNEYTNMVDKYEVRKYIASQIGEEYLIPLIGVYERFEDIDFEQLPNQFVLKPNHTSGNVFICTDKTKIDYNKLKNDVNSWMEREYYWAHREWPYKNIKPKIICEQLMIDEQGKGLDDYKFFCFNGEPKAMFIATDRGIDTRFDFYDMHFNHLPFMQHYKNSTKTNSKPEGFEEMVRLSKVLSRGIPHVRVDFYNINGEIYFGEMTFYHFSGFEKFEPEKYDEIFGSWIHLSTVLK